MRNSVVVICTIILVGIIASSFFSADPIKYKNLQILPQNISPHDMDSTMDLYSSSLGVDCGFCHAGNKDGLIYDSDENKLKLKAREMMRMTDSINHVFFPEGHGTGQTLTCYSCHHGETFPARFKPVQPDKPAWLK